MSTHTTPPPHTDRAASEATEPARRAPSGRRARLQESGSDERGIALQTVIITVVMIAIAGTIAAVLFNAANRASEDLENTDPTAGIFAGITAEIEAVNALVTNANPTGAQVTPAVKTERLRAAFVKCTSSGGNPKKANGTVGTATDVASCASP